MMRAWVFTAMLLASDGAAQMAHGNATEDARRFGGKAFETPYVQNLTLEEKVAGLSRLWAEARYGFANFWHVPGLDWDRTYLEYVPKVMATPSTAEYYKVLTRFYALLQDGHTNVYAPEALSEDRLPLRTRMVEGRVLVVGKREAAFDMQGIRVGDEVLAVNKIPVREYAARNVLPYVSASTPQDRESRTYDYELLLGRAGSQLVLETMDTAGRRMSRTFVVPQGKTVPRSSFEFRMVGDVAYVSLRSFEGDSAAMEFDRHYGEIAKARSVVLDVRENGGGDDRVGARILSVFLNGPAPLPQSVSPKYVATALAWGETLEPLAYPLDQILPDPTRHYGGPVVLLTSARTFSAAEDFAVVFAQAKRGKIVGEATGGSTGQPYSFKLPGGGSARVCTKHDSFADGREFVGQGVQPDIVVAPSVADVRGGRDGALEEALRIARGER